MARDHFTPEQKVRAVVVFLQLKSASAASKELKERGLMTVSYKSIRAWARDEEILAQAKAQAPSYQARVIAFESRDELNLKKDIDDIVDGSIKGLKKVIDRLTAMLIEDQEKKKLNALQLTAIGAFFQKAAGLDKERENEARNTNNITVYQQILNTGKPQ